MTDPRPPAMALDPETLLAHHAWLAALARALVARDDEVDDVVQQTWAQALARPPRHAGNLRGWLGTIARNVVRSSVRSDSARVAREFALPAPPPVETPHEAVERTELRRRVVEAVLALDEPYRSTLILRFFEEQEIGEIARLTSAPEETVRTRLHRGVRRVRARLERDADGGPAALALLHAQLREIAGSGGGVASGSGSATDGVARPTWRLARDATARKVAAVAAIVLAGGAWWIAQRTGDDPSSTPTARVDSAAEATAPEEPPPLAPAERTIQPDGEAPVAVAPTAPPTVADTGTLRGRVTGPDEAPVAGARVWALRCSSFEPEVVASDLFCDAVDAQRPEGPFPASDGWIPTTADEEGRYEFTGLSTLRGWQVGAFDRSRGARVSDLQAFSRQRRELDVDLRLAPGTMIRGRVRDESGNPIGGAIVRLLAKNGSDSSEEYAIAAATGEGIGTYSFGFRCGEPIEIDCRAGGYFTSKRSAVGFETPMDECIVDFKLRRRPGTLVRGRIVDPSGQPLDLLPLLKEKFPAAKGDVQPFRVSLRAIASQAEPPPPDAAPLLWAGAGEGRIDFVARMYEVVVPDDFAGTLELRIAKGLVGSAPLTDPRRPVDVPCDGQLVPADGATAPFALQYVDAETKLPIDLSREAALPEGDDGLVTRTKLKDRSEAHRGLVVYWCAPGHFEIEVRIAGHAPGLYRFDVPSEPPAEPRVVELPRSVATLRGVVRRSDGTPASKVKVTLYRKAREGVVNASGANVATNPDGEFEFASVAAGEHFVVVSRSDDESAGVVPVFVAPSCPPLDIGLTVSQPTRLRVVTSPAPRPELTLVSVRDLNGVVLDLLESRSKGSKPSDSEFSFSLAPGHYVAHVERTGFAERETPFVVPAVDEVVVALDPLPGAGE